MNLIELFSELDKCPRGINGWRDFEDICIKILIKLFVPPLKDPKIQERTISGMQRRDAVFPNREFNLSSTWGQIQHELGARLIPIEFKNYDKIEVSKKDVDQTRSYLRRNMGRLAILCTRTRPDSSAYKWRNTLYGEERKVILFMMQNHLKEMSRIKERGEDPADLIIDLIEEFYLQLE